MTVKEFEQKSEAITEAWRSNFIPLYRAVEDLKGLMFLRIFGTGTTGGSNSAGDKLPTVGYSKTPIYVSPSSVKNAPASFKFGKSTTDSKGKKKKGKPIESLYFPNGYAQLKSQTSANLPLQLTGALMIGFQSSGIENNGLESSITIQSSEEGKVEGLEIKYGAIFEPTNEEIKEFETSLSEFITEAFNKGLQ
jgi:uncharacterized protein YuzE